MTSPYPTPTPNLSPNPNPNPNPNYHKELVRAPYALIAAGTLGAYLAHPYMQAGANLVRRTGVVHGGCLDFLFQ